MFNPFYDKNKFFDMMSEARTRMNDYSRELFHSTFDMMMLGMDDIMRSVGLRHILRHKLIGGGLIPMLSSIMDFEKWETEKFIGILKGDSDETLFDFLKETSSKVLSGIKYDHLVNNLGKQLFGSATFEGEKIIDENDFFTLTYIPAKGTKKAVLFHQGGVLPYSDRIFRFLPETNFFDRFIEAGIDVYAMELKGNIVTNPSMKNLTMDKLIESSHRFTDKAFEHNGGKRMILEGYCGHGMQTAASLLADVEGMQKKVCELMLMVSPIDGRKCNELGDIMNLFPKSMMFWNLMLTAMRGEVVKGDNLQRTIDVAKKSFFEKTTFGRFFHGWKSGLYSDITKIDDLDKRLRMDLAGAYWISPVNATLYPVPVSLAHFRTLLFTVGVSDDGLLPLRYKGKRLNFNDIKKTDLHVTAFYGDLDAMVPFQTADFMKELLGKQFTHIVHEKTGHVSYILSPNRWKEGTDRSFTPGIISTILKHYKQGKVSSPASATVQTK